MKHFLVVIFVMSSSVTMCMQRGVLAHARLLRSASRFAAPVRVSSGGADREKKKEMARAREELSDVKKRGEQFQIAEVKRKIKEVRAARRVSFAKGAISGSLMGFTLAGPADISFVVGFLSTVYLSWGWVERSFWAADANEQQIYKLEDELRVLNSQATQRIREHEED